MIGKLLGFARDIILAAAYGTTRNMDAFSASQAGMLIPAHFVMGEGLNAGFIPLYTKYRRESAERANALFWLMTAGMGGLSLLLAFALLALTRAWMGILVQGFDESALELTIDFSRITLLALPLYVQGNLFSHLEMANRRYFLASIRASVQNIGIMAGILAAVLLKNPLLLAWGFTGSYFVFCLMGAWFAWKEGYAGRPGGWEPGMFSAVRKEFWVIIRPVLFLPLVVQLNTSLERVIASEMGSGVVAAMMFARNLSESGLVLLAWPVGLAGLAEFSRLTVAESRDRIVRMLPLLLIVLVPVSAFLAVNSDVIIRLLFQRGRFDADSVRLASPIFLGLVAGFWSQVIAYVLLRTLNAQMRNLQVALYVSAGMAVNMGINLFAYRHYGPIVLGASVSIGSLVTMLLCFKSLGLGSVALRYFGLLLTGTTLYVPFAVWIRGEGVVPFLFNCAASLLFWSAFILCIPALRGRCIEEFRKRFLRR